MNNNKGLSRRDFMHSTAGLATANFLSAGAPALANVARAAGAAQAGSLAFRAADRINAAAAANAI